jgi:cyclase
VRTVEDARRLLRAGADKIAVNTAAVENPGLIAACADAFGSQAVVAAIDAKRLETAPGWSVFTYGGRRDTGLDVIEHARAAVARGAGEILLTSMDRDGAKGGYDIALLAAVTAAVGVPVIASGGAGTPAARTRSSPHRSSISAKSPSRRRSAPWPPRACPCVPWRRRSHE